MTKANKRKGRFFSGSSNPVLCSAVIMVIAVCVIFGGAPYGPGWKFLLISTLSTILMAVAINAGALREIAKLSLGAKLFLAMCILIPLIQTIPLPPEVWRLFPGREVENQIYDLVGAGEQWHTISLDPLATLFTTFLILPPAAIFLGTLVLGRKDKLLVVTVILALAFISIIIGLMQFTTRGGIFNFYNNSNKEFLLGFFANRNHQGLFIASALVFASSLIFKFVSDRKTALLLVATISFFAIGAVIATASRAGLFLTVLAAFLIIPLNLGLGKKPWRTIAILMIAAAGLFVLFQLTSGVFEQVFDRYSAVEEDDRWQFWVNSVVIAQSYLPVGTGLGTFVPVYAKFEPLAEVTPLYVNHVHNDYLELFIELGWGALMMLGLFLWAFGGAVWKKKPWRKGGLETAAMLVILMAMAHSIVDYPLRREAMVVIFAFSLGLILQAPQNTQERRGTK